MKKTTLLLGGFLLLSGITAEANSTGEKVKKRKATENGLNVSEAKPINLSGEVKNKFTLTEDEFNSLSPAKKAYVQKHSELFIINKK